MKIRRFNESEDSENISPERVGEIIEDLSNITSEIDKNAKMINSILNELENYKSTSKSSNNQVDDASISLDSIKSKLDESTSLIDSTIKVLRDYTESGEKYLY